MDMDLFLLNKLSQIKDANKGGNTAGLIPAMLRNDDGVQPTDTNKPIASIWSTNTRSSSPTNTWSTSLNGTNFYAYDNGTASRFIKFFAPAAGINDSNAPNYRMHCDSMSHDATRGIAFAGGATMGVTQMCPSQSWNTSYSQLMFRIMFVKNVTDAAISFTPYVWYSNHWSSGYDGASLTYYVPNAANYADVTGITTSAGMSSTTAAWSTNTAGSAFTVPARSTVALVLTNTQPQWTSTYSISWTYQNNGFYNLQAMPTGLECDLKATLAYATMRDSNFLQTNANNFEESDVVKFYNNIATLYGENEVV